MLALQLWACKPKSEHSAPIDSAVWIAHVASDSDFAAGFRPREVMATPLWDHYGGHVISTIESKLVGVQKLCKLNLLEAIDTGLVAFNADTFDDLTLILRGVKRSKALSCARAIAANQRMEIDIQEEGALTTLTWGDTVQVLAWLDDKTVLFVPGKSDAAWYADRVAGRDGLNANSAWESFGESVNTTSSLWLFAAYEPTSALGQAIIAASTGIPSEALYASFSFIDGLSLEAGMHFSGEDVAKAMVFMVKPTIDLFKAALGEAGPVMNNVKLVAEGKQMLVSAKMSVSELALFSKEFGPTADISEKPGPALK